MNQIADRSGVTFAVHDVTPAAKPLPECKMHQAMIDKLEGRMESCSDYHSMVVDHVDTQPLLAAVYTAFSHHRPLILTPDAVWITITQGVAHHMTIHGEQLRSRFVAHHGKLDLVFACQGWVEGSPENPWAEAFDSWAGQIRDHVGAEVHDTLVCDFTTSGPVERAVSQVVMMDVFKRYFHYVAYSICGIPTVTLEGTTADWQRLAAKVGNLRVFNLDWWLSHLVPMCDQFVRASRGDVDLGHWRDICKLEEEYGGDIINGWVAKLFPYLEAYTNGPCTRRNPIFDTGAGFQTREAPSGLSRAPFTWKNAQTGKSRMMEAVGGLVGVSQDRNTLSLRPKVGWAIREAEKMDVLLARIAEGHSMFPGTPIESPRGLPKDLCKFFYRTNGAELFKHSPSASYCIRGVNDLDILGWGKISESLRTNTYPNGHLWFRLVDLPDGSSLAINTRPSYPEPLRLRYCRDPNNQEWDGFAAICHCSKSTQGKPGQNPVVALSFTELLGRLLDGGPQPYWLAPGFVGHGDAEEYTRRD